MQESTSTFVYFISVQSTLISIVLISRGAVFVGPICSYAWLNKSINSLFHRVQTFDEAGKKGIIQCALFSSSRLGPWSQLKLRKSYFLLHRPKVLQRKMSNR